MLDTKFSRLLNLPSLMLAGMILTTAHLQFVAAIMTAGYHAEVAGGAVHKPEAMKKTIIDLYQPIFSGRVITMKMIRQSPKILMAVDALASLKNQGLPIDGITIGAGVPSSEAADRILA